MWEYRLFYGSRGGDALPDIGRTVSSLVAQAAGVHLDPVPMVPTVDEYHVALPPVPTAGVQGQEPGHMAEATVLGDYLVKMRGDSWRCKRRLQRRKDGVEEWVRTKLPEGLHCLPKSKVTVTKMRSGVTLPGKKKSGLRKCSVDLALVSVASSEPTSPLPSSRWWTVCIEGKDPDGVEGWVSRLGLTNDPALAPYLVLSDLGCLGHSLCSRSPSSCAPQSYSHFTRWLVLKQLDSNPSPSKPTPVSPHTESLLPPSPAPSPDPAQQGNQPSESPQQSWPGLCSHDAQQCQELCGAWQRLDQGSLDKQDSGAAWAVGSLQWGLGAQSVYVHNTVLFGKPYKREMCSVRCARAGCAILNSICSL